MREKDFDAMCELASGMECVYAIKYIRSESGRSLNESGEIAARIADKYPTSVLGENAKKTTILDKFKRIMR